MGVIINMIIIMWHYIMWKIQYRQCFSTQQSCHFIQQKKLNTDPQMSVAHGVDERKVQATQMDGPFKFHFKKEQKEKGPLKTFSA